jgi:hypothetical protein
MRTAAIVFVLMFCSGMAFAQQPVVVAEMTSSEIQAAIAGGKTTCIVSSGGIHNRFSRPDEFRGPGKDPVVIGIHNIMSNYVGRRIAEILGNALVFDVPFYAMSSGAEADTTLRAIMRDVVTSAVNTGCKLIVIMHDHGANQLALLQKLTNGWNGEFSPKGIRVRYSPVYAESKMEAVGYVSTLKGVPPQCIEKDVKAWVAKNPEDGGLLSSCEQTVIEISEMAAIDNGKWLRKDQVPPSLAKFATAAVGKVILDQKINFVVKDVRAMQSSIR